jgi:hydrogenase/urease accessory protein HupE
MNLFRNLVYSIVLFAIGLSVNAHEVRPAYLQIEQTGENSFHVVWKIPATGMAVPKIYLELPENWKMTSNNASLISNALRQEWNYELNDNIHGGEITFDGLQNTIMDVLVTIKLLNGVKFSGLVKPKRPIYVIPDTPSVWNISKTYLKLGIEHILFGFDHLLFVLALVLITFGGWRIVKTITAFTIAHSITLSLAALGFVHMPSASIEAVIALSIVFLAVELVHFTKGRVGLTAKYPWVVAFIFGLLHGFGFAGALTELGLPQTDIPFALAFFNIGVELGQLVFVMVILVIIFLVNKIKMKPKKWVKLVPAYSIGIIATMWCFERVLGFW